MPMLTMTALRKVSLLCAVLALSVAAPGEPAPWQEDGPEAVEVERSPLRPAPPGDLLVEILGPEGRPLAELDATVLQVIEAGESRPVLSVEPATVERRVVLYFDLLLSSANLFATAAIELGERAESLVALGSVEIVLGDEGVRLALPPTRNPEVVRQALTWLALREGAESVQLAYRQSFLEENGLVDPAPVPPAERGERVESLAEAVRTAVEDETALLAGRRANLLRWLVAEGSQGPGLLILVSGGFDADPLPWYRSVVGGTDLAAALAGLGAPLARPSVEEVGQALSVYDWQVMPYAPPPGVHPLADLPEDELKALTEEERILDIERKVIGIDPRKLFRRKDRGAKGEPAGGSGERPAVTAALLDPRVPLRELARATGGELVEEAEALTGALQRIPQRRRVLYDSGAQGFRGPVPIAVRTSSGDVVRARGWAGRITPEAVAAIRAESFLALEAEEGDLPVSAYVEPPAAGSAGGLTVLFEQDLPADTPLRVSVAMDRPDGSVEVQHYLAGGEGGQPLERAGEGRRVSLPVLVRSQAIVATVVEDLSTGRWGAAFAEELLSESAQLEADALLLPAPKTIHLMAPRQTMVMGRTTFETVVSERLVDRVEFFLDGEPVAESAAAPFTATVELGRLPEARELSAVAYGRDGTVLGRDTLTINEGTGSFRVRIVDPRSEAQRRSRESVTGVVDLEVDVKVPRGGRLARLEYFWEDRLVGTRYAAPFVHRLRVPSADSQGFVRVVGHLEDGALSEDVLFLNSPGATERLEVDLVELYVVVADRRGRHLRDLERNDFKVLEDGQPVALSNFGDAGDLPLTVGLVIDSSASMFVKLPEVQAAAANYIRGLRGRRDRAFVVGFGGEPRLARDTTADLGQVVKGLYRLEPDGRTAIWKAVVYSLVQLQGVAGKKALIVYSDGADEDSDFSYKTALRFARRVGVPVYFILSNDEIYRTGGKSLNIRSFLGRLNNLTHEVGGRVYITRVDEDLSRIYREIDEELHSQYLLGYYPQGAGGDRWREVEVQVGVPGATARTIAGYYR
jgi:Ca-activated chloride channel family protein